MPAPNSSKHWNEAAIRQLLLSNDTAVARAILALYKRQESDEQQARETLKQNGVGFNAADARPLTNYAKLLLRGETLLPGMINNARKRLLKYSSQLLQIALASEAERQLKSLDVL